MSSPVASLGRYFSCCSSFPNQTMGSMPIPVCVDTETVNAAEPPKAKASATTIPVTLSISIPSSFSGISMESNPNSPISLISCLVSSRSFDSICSLSGTTFSVTKSSTIFRISFCSSFSCSRVKIGEEPTVSSIYMPPVFRFTARLSMINSFSFCSQS